MLVQIFPMFHGTEKIPIQVSVLPDHLVYDKVSENPIRARTAKFMQHHAIT